LRAREIPTRDRRPPAARPAVAPPEPLAVDATRDRRPPAARPAVAPPEPLAVDAVVR
jgi:hypothetical protein